MDREFLQLAADAVKARLPDNWGFIILAAPTTGSVPQDQQRTVYVSNIKRESAVAMLKEWLIQASGPEDWMTHIT